MAAPESDRLTPQAGGRAAQAAVEGGAHLDEVAERMTCSTSKISRLETGKGVPKVADVRELMRIYDVASDTERDMLLRLVHDGREHGWWESYTDGVQPERFILDMPGRYASLETDARAVRSFDLTVMHGLLHTEAYSRAVLLGPVAPHRRGDRSPRRAASTQAGGLASERSTSP